MLYSTDLALPLSMFAVSLFFIAVLPRSKTTILLPVGNLLFGLLNLLTQVDLSDAILDMGQIALAVAVMFVCAYYLFKYAYAKKNLSAENAEVSDDVPQIASQAVVVDSDETLAFRRFVTPKLATTFLVMVCLFASIPVNAILHTHENIYLRIIEGCAGIGGALSFWSFFIPRNLTLDFGSRTYATSSGFGLFDLKHKGSLDEITCVHVYSANSEKSVSSYTLILVFGHPELKLAMPMTRPMFTTYLSVQNKDCMWLWNYAKKLASRIGVPLASVGWPNPDLRPASPPNIAGAEPAH